MILETRVYQSVDDIREYCVYRMLILYTAVSEVTGHITLEGIQPIMKVLRRM